MASQEPPPPWTFFSGHGWEYKMDDWFDGKFTGSWGSPEFNEQIAGCNLAYSM